MSKVIACDSEGGELHGSAQESSIPSYTRQIVTWLAAAAD